ncbi:hypothetical protein [Mycobacteroides abscessus]
MIVAPTRNTELMLKVWTHLTEHPEAHNQRNWARRPWSSVDIHANEAAFSYENVCGTTACLCGDAMLLSGYKFRFYEIFSSASGFKRPDGTAGSDFVGEGAKLFGITVKHASHLFTCIMDNSDALMMLRSLIDNDGEFERDLATCQDCSPSGEAES